MRHGMNQIRDVRCMLCSEDEETVNHLFLKCRWSNSLWAIGMAWWGVVFCGNRDVKGWIEGWMGLCLNFRNERAWCSLLYDTVWTIWEKMNALVFEGKKPCLDQAADLVKFQILDKGLMILWRL